VKMYAKCRGAAYGSFTVTLDWPPTLRFETTSNDLGFRTFRPHRSARNTETTTP